MCTHKRPLALGVIHVYTPKCIHDSCSITNSLVKGEEYQVVYVGKMKGA